MSGYPGATHLSRSERVDIPYIIVRYEFDTADTEQQVLDYYRFPLLQKGFLPVNAWGGAIPADTYYGRNGCPTYGMLIAVDATSGHVILELSESRCM